MPPQEFSLCKKFEGSHSKDELNFKSLQFTNFSFSVMEKLPPTSYVRLVDIWLISTQLIPFLLVIMTTSIELFQDHADGINHHGRTRFIKFTFIDLFKIIHLHVLAPWLVTNYI